MVLNDLELYFLFSCSKSPIMFLNCPFLRTISLKLFKWSFRLNFFYGFKHGCGKDHLNSVSAWFFPLMALDC